MKTNNPKRIYILCGDATYNKGDRGNLWAQIKLLKNYFPKAKITVDSYRPQQDKNWYDAKVIKRGLLLNWQQIKNIKKSDFVVWGGGALLTDNASRIKIPYWFFIIFFIRFILQKHIMTWAQGLIIDTSLGKFFGRLTFNMTDLITVRDNNSYAALKRLKVKPPHFKTADPAVLIQPGTPQQGRDILKKEQIPFETKPIFAIAGTFCSFHYDPKDLIPYMIAQPLGLRKRTENQTVLSIKTSLSKLADKLIEDYDCNVLFLPTYPAPWEKDLETFKEIAQISSHQDRIFCLQNDTYSPQEYLSLWNFFNFVVTIPMHHGIFSTVMNVPCVAFDYEVKVKDFFKSINAANRILDINILLKNKDLDEVTKVIDATIKNWKSLSATSQAKLNNLKTEAQNNANYLKKWLRHESLTQLSNQLCVE